MRRPLTILLFTLIIAAAAAVMSLMTKEQCVGANGVIDPTDWYCRLPDHSVVRLRNPWLTVGADLLVAGVVVAAGTTLVRFRRRRGMNGV